MVRVGGPETLRSSDIVGCDPGVQEGEDEAGGLA